MRQFREEHRHEALAMGLLALCILRRARILSMYARVCGKLPLKGYACGEYYGR